MGLPLLDVSSLCAALHAACPPGSLMTTHPPGRWSTVYGWGKEWQEAWERLLVLYRQSEEAEERYHAMAPKMPAALTKTEQDWELDLCARPRDAAEDTFGRDLVEQFRRKPIVRVVQQPAPERGENRTRTHAGAVAGGSSPGG